MADDALARLQVIDRLEVGPVRPAKGGLAMPYAVRTRDGRHQTELRYRFTHDVFDPAAAADVNLATLAGSQVALNYGLFCREIVFRGPLDPADRRFLADMAENTAREIYVKKLLEPNPFLVPGAVEVPVERRRSYLLARLRFPEASEEPIGDAGWTSEPDRYGVLASGGKDSLLSYGLLTELGYETHSLFVNESGRHWYTALNAYRHLLRVDPRRTARIWTSSDRLFAWMLRRLPFIRADFARVRSDEYPIRLWTVAVFLFGALCEARRRGLGRIVIGDEFDTTQRASHAGITHYQGLYDQSRYFDEALTRFYRRKGWPLRQFSLLRPLSELLIQRTLVERYPALQRHQVSCHATHLAGRRVKPCGRCEKCRRIVAMLVGVGADPTACGYTRAQVAECLRAFGERGAHQEAPAAAHLRWLLERRGTLAPGSGPRAREHPEIERLRFHDDRSPVDGVPEDIRRPLYGVLLEHAGGAVARRDRRWEPFDPLEPERVGSRAGRPEAARETETTPKPRSKPRSRARSEPRSEP